MPSLWLSGLVYDHHTLPCKATANNFLAIWLEQEVGRAGVLVLQVHEQQCLTKALGPCATPAQSSVQVVI